MARGYHGPEDPDKGRPNRHTRQKVRLMLADETADRGALTEIILMLAEKRPEDTLDAVLAVLEPDG